MNMIAEQQLVTWLQRLVSIPSVTPSQAGPRSGPPGEERIATAIVEWFRALGGEVIVEEVLPGRPNVYGIWRGRSSRWAALDVHVDTVGVEQMPDDPFAGDVRDGRVHGRGAVDTKASLAVALAVLESLQQSGRVPEANLLIGATVDEEDGARGAPAFARWIQQSGLAIDQLIVAEPTVCRPVYGHKGVVRLVFEVIGEAAHSSQPQLGKNAITAAAHLVLAIDAEAQRMLNLPVTSPLGAPALTATLINGGRGINVVPDRCSVSIDRRVVSGEHAEEIAIQLIDLAQRISPLPITVRRNAAIDAFLQESGTDWLRQLAVWSGYEPTIAPYGTNAYAYPGFVRECVVLGPGSIDQAHGADEWIEIAELSKLAQIYQQWWGSAS